MDAESAPLDSDLDDDAPLDYDSPAHPVLDTTDPALVAARLRLYAGSLLSQRGHATHYAADCWAFLTQCVNTIDEARNAVREFPAYPYLRRLIEVQTARAPDGRWIYPLTAVPKSRRMLVTWANCARLYHLARFTPYARIGIMARKEGRQQEEGSNELVLRCKQINDHIRTVTPAAVTYATGRLSFVETGSTILALSQGADQARQFTFTALLIDEAAFMPWAHHAYVGARPTIEGGGRIDMVSSPNPGFFHRVVRDDDLAGVAR